VKEFLSQKGVPFQELDVARDARARDDMIKRSGMMAVPTILVDDQVVVGFDRQRLNELLH